jgi:hypothetical protein
MKSITLLDGKQWNKEDLLKEMQNDEFYYGYLSKAALSSSSLKLLLSSPKTYKYVSQYGNAESQALRDGWLFHTAILEPDVFNAQKFIDVESKNTKAYKEAKLEFGKVFTKSEKRDAERLADAFFRNEKALQYITNCEFEVPEIGEVYGLPFRGKADILGKNRIVDLKSVQDIKAFPHSARKYGYNVQCFLYCNLFNISYKDFTFIALDKSSLDIGVFHCSEEFYYEGEKKVEEAIEIYDLFFLQGIDTDQYYIEGIL